MRASAMVVVVVVACGPAWAQDAGWERESFDNGIEAALAGNANDAVAAVRCIEGTINIFFQVPKARLDPALKAGDGIVDLTLNIDGSDDIFWARVPLYVSIENYIAAEYFGRDAALWAEKIAGAEQRIEMSFAMGTGATVDQQFNVEGFAASGSTTATNAVLALCAA